MANPPTNLSIGDPVVTLSGAATSNWEFIGPFPLPGDVIRKMVRIEWRFTGPIDSPAFLGAYIDDVTITGTGW